MILELKYLCPVASSQSSGFMCFQFYCKNNWRNTEKQVVLLHVPCGYNGSYPARYPLGLLLMFCRLRLRSCRIESQRGKDIIRRSPAVCRCDASGGAMSTWEGTILNHAGRHVSWTQPALGLDRKEYRRPLGGRCGVFEKETINTE